MLGNLIKKLREEKGYSSLRSFAKAVGKSPTFMWKVEQEEAVPGVETLNKIVELLGHKDEIFKAADRVQPEIENIIKEDDVVYFLRKVSQMPSADRKIWIKNLESEYNASSPDKG